MHGIFIAAALGLTLTAIVPDAAEARTRARGVSIQASDGRGLVRQRAVTRQPGNRAASRSVATNDGRSLASSRSASWGTGSYAGGASYVTTNGTNWGRATSVTADGQGGYTGAMTRTGADGSSTTRTKTVTRP